MFRYFRRVSPLSLGRWSTAASESVVDKRARMADHDSCGAHDCQTPIHLADVDDDDEWYARCYYDANHKSKKIRYTRDTFYKQ